MSWFGKLLGGAVGYAIGGPIGALVGVALGHNLDRGSDREAWSGRGADAPGLSPRERTQTAFFTAVFAVMGHLSKADGQVTRDEIRVARRVMDEMRLGAEQRRLAQRLFTEGKAAGFPVEAVLDQLRRECHRSRHLLTMFVEILLHAAYADAALHPREHEVLARVCERLGLGPDELERLEKMARAEAEMRSGGGSHRPSVEDAYAVLGISPACSDAEVKRAYRRLMSQHHPDKLVAKGLPEEMMRIATEQTQEIKLAYERVREARGV